MYGRLNMLVQAQFQSNYGLALYENCIRFQGIRQTPWFDIIKFRKLMGIEEGQYKIFRDFKHRVLDKAVEEVNKYSPIRITLQFRRKKRRVIAIQFIIKQEKELQVINTGNQLRSSLSSVLKLRFGLSKKQIEEVMTMYDEGYIREKMSIIESSVTYVEGKINHLSNYLICALKDDYKPIKSRKKALKVIHTEKIENEKQKIIEQNRAEEYRRFQNKEILKLFGAQLEFDQKAILIEFEKQLGKSIYRDIYLRDGLANILIQDQLCLFIKHIKPKFIEEIIPYNKF